MTHPSSSIVSYVYGSDQALSHLLRVLRGPMRYERERFTPLAPLLFTEDGRSEFRLGKQMTEKSIHHCRPPLDNRTVDARCAVLLNRGFIKQSGTVQPDLSEVSNENQSSSGKLQPIARLVDGHTLEIRR